MNDLGDPLAIAQALIRCPSITPDEAGAIDVVEQALDRLGFTCHRLRFASSGGPPVRNLYARIGRAAPNLAFAGHTDVVPPGDVAAWRVDPFAGEVIERVLYGRGAVDMKGAIACFIAAAARFLEERRPAGSISLLITGDEEGPAINGTRRMLEWLRSEGEVLDGCVVGEPTNPARVGEMIKIGRRGSLSGRLRVTGRQGHTAYPDQADNPIPRLLAMLSLLDQTPLDGGSEYFEPSRLVLTSVDVGNQAGNVIPGEAAATFNVRFNDRHSPTSLEQWLRRQLDAAGGPYVLETGCSGEAFITLPGPFTELLESLIERELGIVPELSTSGGTSDARFIKDVCPVVEFGLVSATIHAVDERVAVADLEALTQVYRALLESYVRPA
jgi:succinyl-diaminopimelate desuccinylase